MKVDAPRHSEHAVYNGLYLTAAKRHGCCGIEVDRPSDFRTLYGVCYSK
jgi:hypothetical protein